MPGPMSFAELLRFYTDHLTQQVMPFWTRLVDWECGGLDNCVGDDGTVQSTDRFMWSQGRALWTFSALYNDLDGGPEWLRIADRIAGFLKEHGRDEDGAWAFRLLRDGSVAEGPTSIYVDAFLLYGLTEYARATGDAQALDIAVQTYRRTSPLLDDHSTLPTEPHPIPAGVVSHGPSMIFALLYHELGRLLDDAEVLARAFELAEVVMSLHLRLEDGLLYEFVSPEGDLVDSDVGRTFIPGHAIESMWFMERVYRHHDRQDRIALAMDAIRWHLEKGWDEEYGGLYLACSAGGGTPVWHQPDAKVWWPHTEALYALLKAHQVTREPWCMEWYWRVHDYAFSHFPDREHGDWHQNLDRYGNRIPVVLKNLAVKDPFHLPRALLYSILVLRELAGESGGT